LFWSGLKSVWQVYLACNHSNHPDGVVPLSCNVSPKYQSVTHVSRQSFPSLAALGNQLALLAVVGTLGYAFVDQLNCILVELPAHFA
jgi:hypothetical protein